MTATARQAEPHKCPKCQHAVGTDLDTSALDEKNPAMCCCVRCLSMVWLFPNNPPTLLTNREIYTLCLMKPQEMLSVMALSLDLNAKLPRVKIGEVKIEGA